MTHDEIKPCLWKTTSPRSKLKKKKKEIIEPGIPSGGKGETGVTEGNVQARILPQILFAGLFKGGDNHCANKLLLPDEEH